MESIDITISKTISGIIHLFILQFVERKNLTIYHKKYLHKFCGKTLEIYSKFPMLVKNHENPKVLPIYQVLSINLFLEDTKFAEYLRILCKLAPEWFLHNCDLGEVFATDFATCWNKALLESDPKHSKPSIKFRQHMIQFASLLNFMPVTLQLKIYDVLEDQLINRVLDSTLNSHSTYFIFTITDALLQYRAKDVLQRMSRNILFSRYIKELGNGDDYTVVQLFATLGELTLYDITDFFGSEAEELISSGKCFVDPKQMDNIKVIAMKLNKNQEEGIDMALMSAIRFSFTSFNSVFDQETQVSTVYFNFFFNYFKNPTLLNEQLNLLTEQLLYQKNIQQSSNFKVIMDFHLQSYSRYQLLLSSNISNPERLNIEYTIPTEEFLEALQLESKFLEASVVDIKQLTLNMQLFRKLYLRFYVICKAKQILTKKDFIHY